MSLADSRRPTRGKRRFRHIASLDGIRGIAVLTVFFHHVAYTSLGPGRWNDLTLGFAALFREGHLGVDLFFVLSGYLITTLLLIDRRDPNGYWNFYVKRAFRILPVLLATFVIGAATGYLGLGTIVLGLLFIVNYARLLHVPVQGVYWSLAVEEQFYLVWPIAIRKLPYRRFMGLVPAVILVEPFVRLFLNHRGMGTSVYTFVRCDGLAWGALLGASAYYARIYAAPERARAWWARYGRRFTVAGAVLFVAMLALLSARDVGLQSNTVIYTVMPLFFAGVMAYLVSHPGTPVSRLFEWRPLRFYGDISYALYLVHPILMFLYDRRWPVPPGDSAAFWTRMAVLFATSSGLCALSLRYFERPVMRHRTKYLRGGKMQGS